MMPSDIIWKNLKYTKNDRTKRMIVSALINLGLLIFGFILII